MIKERAEHLMLVDLARNDVGKVSEFGTVNGTRVYGCEKILPCTAYCITCSGKA